MGLNEIVPAIFLLAVLILIIPSFVVSNSKSKIFFKNLIIWSIIVVLIVVVSFSIFK